MPYFAKGKIMHSPPWNISSLRNPFPAATLTTLVGVVTAGAFLYAIAATLAHQHSADTAHLRAGTAHAREPVEGGVQCWGYNTDGKLGDGTAMARLAPVQVAGLSAGVAAITASGYHTCAPTSSGAVDGHGGDLPYLRADPRGLDPARRQRRLQPARTDLKGP